MDIWFLFQVAINLVLVGGLAVVWTKLKRPPQDDPRLSRGLQLLQSKISVLEDLSDRTDRQVEQLTQLLEQKTRHLQTKTFEAEKLLQKVDQSMHRSLEVAEIFQDKIPHDEIIERQNTVKYVLAAQLSHKGMSIEEISEKVDLPREQIEFIAKVNKEELMFDREQLPPWAKTQLEKLETGDEEFDVDQMDLSSFDEDLTDDETEEEWGVTSGLNMNFPETSGEMSSLKKLGEEFRQACIEFDEKQHRFEEEERQAAEPSKIAQAAQKMGQRIIESSSELINNLQTKSEGISNAISSELTKEKTQAPNMATPAPKSAEVKAERKFLPLQPESPSKPSNPILKTKVHSASTRSDSARMQTKEVPNNEIKKVLFPRIDLDDQLG